MGRNSLKQTARRRADQTGSVALSTWVNEIAPAPNEMTPPTCVAARKNPCDESVLMLSNESLGVLRSPVAHSINT
eukprot:scaffold8023_cov103-Isochrysis_galbana.AAC.21